MTILACIQRYARPGARLIVLLSLLQSSVLRGAEEWKGVFNPYQVLTLHLQLDSNDWDRVRHDAPSQSEGWIPELAEALMWADGETPIRVQIRRKGESDIPLPEGDPQKVSLKVDVNALVEGQRWRGLTKLSLENGSEDPLNEGFAWVAQRLAWEAGIYGYEAAYSGWVRLFVNGQLKGVYVNAEQKDVQFLKNRGYDKGPSTWLYKVDGSSTLEAGIGHSPAYQHLCFAPFNAGPGGGGGGGGCAQPNLEVDLPQWINLRGFFTLGAVEAFLENRDGLFTHSGKNSYAVDFDPPFPNTRLYFPWDQDTTIGQGNASIYGNEPYQQQLLMHPWFGKVYEQLLRDLIDGPFSVAALHGVIDRLEAGIGAAFDEDPYVYGGDSASAFASLRSWVNKRVPNVRAQLTQPYLPRPMFNQMGGEVIAGFQLTMTAPTGAVYYTLDGSDPRAPGGLVSGTATRYTGPVTIERTTPVIARAFDGTHWTPLPVVANFNIARYGSALRITELMYHPASGGVAGDEDNYEFIELKNTGVSPLDVSGFSFEGITYTFPAGTIIPVNSFYVLARSRAAMASRYPGVTVHGIYTGKLDDGGEKIRLRNSDTNTIVSVEYNDEPPWVLSPDGLGYSLVLWNADGHPDSPEAWRASRAVHGSPGADDPAPVYGLGVVINEVLTHADPPFEDAIELHNTGESAADISGWYLSDDFVRTNPAASYGLKKFRIPAGTVVAPGGFVVFYERDFRSNNPAFPFGLSEFGETVYLSSAAADGTLNGYVAGATFEASENGVSIGRYSSSRGVDFVPLSRTTFGSDTPISLAEFRAGTGAANAEPRIGPMVINEIMYNPAAGGTEFLEFLNVGAVALDISGWSIAGAGFTFPSGTVVPANGLVLLLRTNGTSVASFRSSFAVPAAVPIFAHDFVLENEGEAMRIEKPNSPVSAPPFLIERIRYNDKSPWPPEADGEGPSLERFAAAAYGNDPINWRTVEAGGSPGRLNVFNAGIAVAKGSSWKFQASGANLGTAWREIDYSDSGWPDGDGPLGYGAAGLGTVIPSGTSTTNKPINVYFRKEFVINDPLAAITHLRLETLYDDGFVLYLNGAEVLRSGSMPGGVISYNTTAASSYNSIGYELFDLSAHRSLLRAGNNVLCAEVHQVSSSSEDLVWDASLTFDISSLPSVSRPAITPDGGLFTEAVSVTLATQPTNAAIYYTLNGTNPDQRSIRYAGPFTVETTTEVRARAYSAGYNESEVATAVFQFPDPGVLDIVAADTLPFSGIAGGPFSPVSHALLLTNTGGTSLTWSAGVSAQWLSLSIRSGTVAASSSAIVSVSVNSVADSLSIGSYDSVVSFTNVTSGMQLSRAVSLSVRPIRLLSGRDSGDGAFYLKVAGEPNAIYVVEASSDLEQWTTISTNAADTNGWFFFSESQGNVVPQRFYRARPPR